MKNSSAIFTVILPVLCALVFLEACTAPRNVRVAPLFADDPYWAHVAPKQESEVFVTEGDLQRKYRPIAKIFVESKGKKLTHSFARMKDEGAKIGADAVIKIKVSSQYMGQTRNPYLDTTRPINRHTLEGIAVVFED